MLFHEYLGQTVQLSSSLCKDKVAMGEIFSEAFCFRLPKIRVPALHSIIQHPRLVSCGKGCPTSQGLHKLRGFHGCDYEECRTSQERHYVSATEHSRLMLCKLWGFQGGDHEECRLLGYETPVRTAQKTHYVSAREPSWLMLCTIWSFHGGVYEECRLLGYYDVWLLKEPTFRKNVSSHH
jgi:hypothetical protein